MDSRQTRWSDDYVLNDKYKLIQGLGRGFEGFCTLEKSKTTGKLIVMKHVSMKKKEPPKEAKMLLQELRPHRNIVRAFAAQRSPLHYRTATIHMEYCTGGDLIDQLSHFCTLGMDTPPIFALHVFIGLTNALAYIHHGICRGAALPQRDSRRHQPIIHCDIKPDNVLLRWGSDLVCGMPDIVLADFGAARFEENSWGADGGTYDYHSPEARAVADLSVKRDKEGFKKANNASILTAKSDMYSLGVVTYLVAAGRHWRCGKDPQRIRLPQAYMCRPQKEADRSDPNHHFIFDFLHAVVWCLQPHPDDRPQCSRNKYHGLLFTTDSLQRQRDAMFAKNGPLPKNVWNVNAAAAQEEKGARAVERWEALVTGSRKTTRVEAVDSMFDSMQPLTRVRAHQQ